RREPLAVWRAAEGLRPDRRALARRRRPGALPRALRSSGRPSGHRDRGGGRESFTMTLIVCPLPRLPDVIAARRPSHLVTLLSPEELIETPAGVDPSRHLRLGVHDIAVPEAGLIAPDAAMVEQVLAFAQGWDAAAPMVVHCWAGISRST